ncbi:MAG: putative transposase for insertion sequence [Methylocystaceae bacterium]|nr:MAG: putative transposase for insertion sequence [Methylocystaceae bacterium]
MSTRMDEEDWAHTLTVFRACLPRRGRKGEDDRRFLEALHFFTLENVRWRALPERFGRWNSVWKRFDRLSKAGVFEAFFDTLASMSSSAHLIQMFDSTIVRAHVSAAGAKGGKTRRREAADAPHFETLLDIGPDIQPRVVICDKGYASKDNRAAARSRGVAPVIPYKANEKNKPAFFARTLYKARSRIEQGFGRLKRFKRIALRCEKTARNFRSIVSFAAGLCLIKFVHTA